MPRTFTLLRTLGRGAHGSVHLAEVHDEDDFVQTLAVKRLLPEVSGNKNLAARLKDEARLLALLNHDHIVRVHGLTQIDGGLAILMEPVDGVDMARLVPEGPVPARAAAQICGAVADALDAAWTACPPGQGQALKVVHRDIKPSNVMVTPRGGVKVMDFGVARATFDAREVETRSQQLGTARYMAPERWLQAQAGHASDVFSLGITLIEIATGRSAERPRLARPSFDADLAELLARIEAVPLRDLAGEMCAFEADDRPTAGAVATRCRALAGALPGPGLRDWAARAVVPREGEPVDPTATGTVVVEDASVHSTTQVQPTPSSPRWVRGLPILGVLAAIGIWAATRGPTPAAPEPVPAAVVVPEPVDAPPQPEPQPIPEPVPDPVPRAPEPTPRPSPAPPPDPLPIEAPAPEPPMTRIRFVLADGLTVETDWGTVTRSPGVLALPADRAVEVRVREGDARWSCAIAVGTAFDEVRIEPEAEGGCTQ